MPHDNYEFFYNLFPLKAGHNTLPKLHIKLICTKEGEVMKQGDELDSIVQRMVTSDIYVMPFKRPQSDQ